MFCKLVIWYFSGSVLSFQRLLLRPRRPAADSRKSGTCKRGRQKGFSLICSDLLWLFWNKSEEIGSNRNHSGYSWRQGTQIGVLMKTRNVNRKKSAWRILGKWPAKSANFDGEFFPLIFRHCFSRVSGPPQKNKFTPKIHAQNCRHSSPISFSRTQIFSRQFSAYGGDQFLVTPHNGNCLCFSYSSYFLPREASTLLSNIRSCIASTDLQNTICFEMVTDRLLVLCQKLQTPFVPKKFGVKSLLWSLMDIIIFEGNLREI